MDLAGICTLLQWLCDSDMLICSIALLVDEYGEGCRGIRRNTGLLVLFVDYDCRIIQLV